MESQIKPLLRKCGMMIPLFLTAAVLYAQNSGGSLSSDELLQLAQRETVNQHYNQAMSHCSAALKLAPADDDIHTLMGRLYVIKQQYAAAREEWKQVLTRQPRNKDVLLYMISLEAGCANYTEAIVNCAIFLRYFPADSLVMAKQAGLYMLQKQYSSAIAVAAPLQRRYTSDVRLTDLCADAWWLLGKECQAQNKPDSAMMCYRQVLQYHAADTLALVKLAGGFMAGKQYDSVLLYAQQGLQQWPGQVPLLREKAVALDNMGRYTEAVRAIMEWKQNEPGNKRLNDYLLQVKAKQYRNQLGILHLQSFYNNGTSTAFISSVQYLRRFKKVVLLGRVNYGDRQSGNGIQPEAEVYVNHDKQNYSWAWLGWSNSVVFPKYRASYSWFHGFAKGWEGELGFRYLKADTIHTYTPVISIAKSAGNYWGNLRGFFTRDAGKWYQSAVFTNRFYQREAKDFLAVMLGIGVSPDDRSRNFQFGRLLGMTTTSATLGYQKYLGVSSVIAAYATWSHVQMTGIPAINQYDIYVSFYQNF